MVSKMRWALTASVLVGMFVCPAVRAEEPTDANAQLLEAIQALRAEVSALKAEVAKVRTDQAQILADLRIIKTSAKPQPPTKDPRKPDTTVYDLPAGNSPFLGKADAPVVITEFVCLQCPYCIREYPKLQKVVADYPDKVKVVFKNFPLSFHKKAKPVHAACAIAAKTSNEAFWKVHDKIIANPKDLEPATMRGYLEEVGADVKEYDAVVADADKMDALWAADTQLARKSGVRGTPSVFINGLKMAKRTPEAYKEQIDSILAGGDKQAQPGQIQLKTSSGKVVPMRKGGLQKIEKKSEDK